jgi:ACS family hexuronate transporter-like MFS transporter
LRRNLAIVAAHMKFRIHVHVANEKRKWWMLGFAFLATVINYLNRQTLSVMAPALMLQFRISATSYSHIIFAFMLAYTLMNGVSGRLLDRLGTRIGYSLTIAFWSSAELLNALSAGALSLGFFQFLLGIGEAGNYPAGVKLIAEWFPVEERSHASGIFNSGASIGAILAPPLLAWIALASGWRTAFVMIGLLGFLWLAGWLGVYQEPHGAIARDQSERLPLRRLLRSRFLWQFTLSKVFSDPVWYFYAFWFPQYLKVAHSFSLRQIGATAWIPFFTATVGNLAGGAVFTGLLRTGTEAATARRVAILIFTVLMVSAVFVGDRNNAAQCIALISTATFGYSGALANLLAVPGDVFPKGAVASIWGFASVGSGVGGRIFSLVTGWLVDHVSFRPVFVLFGAIPFVAAWLVWTLPRKTEFSELPPGTEVGSQSSY